MRPRPSATRHPEPARRRARRLLPCLATLALLATPLGAQTEEFELKDGRRIPAADVTPTKTGFTAKVTTGTTAQTVNFTAKDVLRATLAPPAQLAEARTLTASGRSEEAASLMEKLLPELETLQSVPGNWWHLAAILQMDALAARGKLLEAEIVVTNDSLASLPEDAATMIGDFQRMIAKPAKSPELKVGALEALAKRSTDPWFVARARFELGNLAASQGQIEDAIKKWLRVAIFHAAETDLAVRALTAAARGLQQIERSADGVKLLTDYLADHPGSPYGEAIRTEILKLDPTLKDKLAASAEDKAAGDKPAEEKPAEDKAAGDKPAEDKPAGDKPAEEKPAEDKPAEDKPAEDKPAEDKPAEDKPAEEKPAEDKPATPATNESTDKS